MRIDNVGRRGARAHRVVSRLAHCRDGRSNTVAVVVVDVVVDNGGNGGARRRRARNNTHNSARACAHHTRCRVVWQQHTRH
jgi:hypothetical protein